MIQKLDKKQINAIKKYREESVVMKEAKSS
jgi:hypothetical protein